MKKSKVSVANDLRTEYKRDDFPVLERGKYVARLNVNSNVVVIDPDVTDLFPNGEAVNAALRSLVEIARKARAARRR